MAPAAIITVALLAACSSTPATDGPLQLGGDPSHVCSPRPADGKSALGINLPTDINQELVIASVTAVNAKNLKVAGFWLMPVTEHFRLLIEPFPPVDNFASRWAMAEQGPDIEVGPGVIADLVVELDSNGADSSADAMQVNYSVNGTKYTSTTNMGLLLTDGTCD